MSACPNCPNLSELYGDEYRVSHDPAYNPAHVPQEKRDPWMMLLEFRGGNIYPYGDGMLAVEIEGRKPTRRALAALPGLTTTQDGDQFQAWKFPIGEFDAVAKMVRPRKRRRLTTSQREAAKERLQAYQYRRPRAPALVSSHD